MRRIETPAARFTDPESSHLAAAEITASGARAHQMAQAVAAVRAFPRSTSFELAMATELDRYMLGRRLADARTAGQVRNVPPGVPASEYKVYMRHCRVTGRMAMRWCPVDTSEPARLAA
jgi:hypothetical protein